MTIELPRALRWLAAGFLSLVLALAAFNCRADTVASLLGDFTINQFCGIALRDDAIAVRYSVVLGQLPALRELHLADTNGDGVTSQAERDAYVENLAPTFAEHLRATVDGIPLPLHVTRWTTSLPTEQGGFSLRLDVDLAADLPQAALRGSHDLQFTNDNYAGRFGWQEIAVEARPAIHVYDTDAFGSSLTSGLTEAVAQLPAAGPLSERSVHMTVSTDPVPAGSRLLAARDGVPLAVAQPTTGVTEAAWLSRQTRALIDAISAPDVAPHILLLACLAAMLLGALHAFSPGHGKTVVGAYLIGSRATPRHAVFLGLTVTVTHTLVVFAVGFATLFASRFVVPERLFPILSLASGLLVLGMGVVLFNQRWRLLRAATRRQSPEGQNSTTAWKTAPVYRSLHTALPSTFGGRSLVLAHVRGHQHAHSHPDGEHSHHGALMHSHGGGAMHSHLPPGAAGEKITWRSLLALGISGGLVPCPSAMVLLLAAVGLNKTAYGLLLVGSFSVGLAATLVAVGLVFLYARHRMRGQLSHSLWQERLPVLSAIAIALVGAALCYGAVAGTSFL